MAIILLKSATTTVHPADDEVCQVPTRNHHQRRRRCSCSCQGDWGELPGGQLRHPAWLEGGGKDSLSAYRYFLLLWVVILQFRPIMPYLCDLEIWPSCGTDDLKSWKSLLCKLPSHRCEMSQLLPLIHFAPSSINDRLVLSSHSHNFIIVAYLSIYSSVLPHCQKMWNVFILLKIVALLYDSAVAATFKVFENI